MYNALNAYATKNKIYLESVYPYTAVNGNCDTTKTSSVYALTEDVEKVTQNSSTALKTAIAEAPVSIGIEAD
jgi:Papain family cysteine protease